MHVWGSSPGLCNAPEILVLGIWVCYVYYMLYAYMIIFRMSFILHEHLINDFYVFMLMHDYIIGKLYLLEQ